MTRRQAGVPGSAGVSPALGPQPWERSPWERSPWERRPWERSPWERRPWERRRLACTGVAGVSPAMHNRSC
ncbi:MAG: hypothetical protein EHM23_30930, partial [Acidobacteria bacterium]